MICTRPFDKGVNQMTKVNYCLSSMIVRRNDGIKPIKL